MSDTVAADRHSVDADRFDLRALEFQSVRSILLERLTTPLGRRAVEALVPMPAVDANRALGEAREIAQRLASGDEPQLGNLVEVRAWLDGFFAGENLLDTREVAELKRVVRSARRNKGWLSRCGDLPHLCAFGGRIPDVADLVDELESMIDDSGEVLDSASGKLAELRREIHVADSDVRAAVQRFVQGEGTRKFLQSPEPSWRHGRPVFQVRQEYRHMVPGVLHDRSQSGATLFVEPSSIVEVANRLSDAKAAEHREILVILARIGRGLRRCEAEVRTCVEAVAELDLAHARARLVHEDQWFPASIERREEISLRSARHPMLALTMPPEDVVPLDVTLGDPYRVLVVTGPNTGGKTVALKTLGLLSTMGMCGLPIPAGEGSRLADIDGVFVDIGDEQGIEQSLSTFSSHVQRISRCLSAATSRSLLLIDELGAGTDPEEGSALGYSVLEAIGARRALACVTTHLGRLKDFAYENAGAQNGSMTFNGKTLQPEYRLEVGVPGASHALDIAMRVGMPAPLVERARELLGSRDASVEQVVERVEEARREAEAERQRTAQLTDVAAKRERELEQRHEELERRRMWLHEEADAVVEEQVRRVQGVVEERLKSLVNAPKPFGDTARELQVELAGSLRHLSIHRRRMAFVGGLRKDTVVFVPRLGRRCVVKKLDRVREICTVEVGKLRMELSFDELSWLQPLDAK